MAGAHPASIEPESVKAAKIANDLMFKALALSNVVRLTGSARPVNVELEPVQQF
jgi:hypothetical protein